MKTRYGRLTKRRERTSIDVAAIIAATESDGVIELNRASRRLLKRANKRPHMLKLTPEGSAHGGPPR